jgi:hypothetical protein
MSRRRGWDYPKLRFGSGVRASLLTLARDAPHQSNGVRISAVPHATPSDSARLFDVVKLAEGVGFEPTKACALPVFKTGAINRSTTPPEISIARSVPSLGG